MGESRITCKDMSDSAASLGFQRNVNDASVTNGRLLHRVWSEQNWAVAVLFAALLIGSWVMVIANEVNPIVGNTNWFRIVTSAILTGLLPVVALLVLHFAWRHRNASSALALAESRMRDMVEASSDWLWEMGPDLRFTSVSNRVPGLNKTDIARLIGMTWNEAMNVEFEAAAWSRHPEALAERRPFRDFVYLDKTPSGELRWRKVPGRLRRPARGLPGLSRHRHRRDGADAG